jgi:5-methyltetrahydrofolate--homocysteine methyltransferase
MKETIDAIASAGLRDNMKIMIGGGQIYETESAYTGADAIDIRAVMDVTLCKGWAGVAA